MNGCGIDLDEAGNKALSAYRGKGVAAWKAGGCKIHEEIGIVILNEYAIARVAIDDEDDEVLVRMEVT